MAGSNRQQNKDQMMYGNSSSSSSSSSTPDHMLPIKKVPARVITYSMTFLLSWMLLGRAPIDPNWNDFWTIHFVLTICTPIFVIIYVASIRQKT